MPAAKEEPIRLGLGRGSLIGRCDVGRWLCRRLPARAKQQENEEGQDGPTSHVDSIVPQDAVGDKRARVSIGTDG